MAVGACRLDSLAGKPSGAMHVSKIVSRRAHPGVRLVRRSFQEGDKVGHETLTDLSALPEAIIEAVRASLTGKTLVAAGDGLLTARSLPHARPEIWRWC